MAPIVQPKRLYRLCLTSMTNLIDSACTNIFLEHGCYGNEDCIKAMEQLQKFLVSQLPTTVFEALSDDRNSHIQNQPLWSKDARIKLGVFLHSSITKFAVDGKSNELMQNQDDGLDEFFWCSQIKRLNNLVCLNLSLITTDEILLLVGESCPKLEVVNVMSRIKQDFSHDLNGYPGPGITLKFCVSDFGLRALLKCQKLRRITMNKIVNYSNSSVNQGITLYGVRDLIKGLPNLEYINFGSMGKVLQEENYGGHLSLKLKYFSEIDTSFVNVPNLTRLCPNLQHISLCVPININSQGYINPNVAVCSEILKSLADTDLRLRIVELQHFPFGEPFKDFLRSKGPKIEELTFLANGQLNSTHLILIGEHCPSLLKLTVKEVSLEETPYRLTSELAKMQLFSNLTNLQIQGRVWNPNVIIPLMLSSAKDIRQICLLNMQYRQIADSAFLRLLQYNKLEKLITLNLFSGCYLSLPVIRQLIYECPKLSCISFMQFEGLENQDVELLKNELMKKNLDIKVNFLELLDF